MELAFISIPQLLNDHVGSQDPPQSGLSLLFLTSLALFWLTGNSHSTSAEEHSSM